MREEEVGGSVKRMEVTQMSTFLNSWWWHSFGVTYKSRHIFRLPSTKRFPSFLILFHHVTKHISRFAFTSKTNHRSSRENFSSFFICFYCTKNGKRKKTLDMNKKKSNDIWNLNWIFLFPLSFPILRARRIFLATHIVNRMAS